MNHLNVLSISPFFTTQKIRKIIYLKKNSYIVHMYYNAGKSSEFKSDNVKRFDLLNKFSFEQK